MSRHNSSSSGSSSCLRPIQSSYVCSCGGVAVVRTVKAGPNIGRRFHGCPLWPHTSCNFFKWVDDNNQFGREINDLRFEVLAKDTTIAEMEYEKQLMEEKIKALQLKKENLEEDVKQLKVERSENHMELMKMARIEKYLTKALLFSWVVIAFLLF
ncbi:DNA topoisomerase 3-alpha [Bienertia sinuspersici]